MVRYLRKSGITGVTTFIVADKPLRRQRRRGSVKSKNKYTEVPATWRLPPLKWLGGQSSGWLQ